MFKKLKDLVSPKKESSDAADKKTDSAPAPTQDNAAPSLFSFGGSLAYARQTSTVQKEYDYLFKVCCLSFFFFFFLRFAESCVCSFC